MLANGCCVMPGKSRRYGSFEYGDIYEYDDSQPDNRGEYIGRLVVDQDNDSFYCRTKDRAARRLSRDQVAWMVAKDIIEFDHADSRARLIDYMMKLDERKEKIRQARTEQYAKQKASEQLQVNEKLVRKTKRRSRMSKMIWLAGCFCVIALGVLAAQPAPEAKQAIPSIEGDGAVVDVDASLVKDASYMTAMGNGADMYGLIFDDAIVESGQQNANESSIEENILVNPSVSGKYPVHLRPLYYDRSTFYQSQVILNDSNGGSTAVCLQNPNGYSLGYAANQLVLLGGAGVSSTVISDPGAFEDTSASDAAQSIEQRQRAMSESNSGSSLSSADDKDEASKMPDSWNGYDYADIDANKIAASYWYTKNGSKKKEDLKRRIAVWDVSSVLNGGEDAVSSLEPIQMNYQDKDSSFYAPVISMSPSSNGSVYWIGYMKQVADGSTGFYIRKYEDADDVLLESYNNTLSTKDLTNEDYPITNYMLYGDMLFFEQQGYIWCIDLSKISIDVNGTTRTIKKENPVKICRSSEIKPDVSRDEKFIASETGAATVPVSHYKVMTITTDKGVEYGITFIEAGTNNLVFQPVNGATVATEGANSGEGGNSNTSNGVSSGDQSALDAANARNAERNGSGSSNSANVNGNSSASGSNAASGNGSTGDGSNALSSGASGQGQSSNGTGAGDVGSSNGIARDFVDGMMGRTSYTVNMPRVTASIDGGDEKDNGRVLIRAGSDDYQIVCFCARGEQVYWIEQSNSDGSRTVKVSPVFYKNEKQKLESETMVQDNDDNSENVEGIAPENNDNGNGNAVTSTRPDTIVDSNSASTNEIADGTGNDEDAGISSNDGNTENQSDSTAGASASSPSDSGGGSASENTNSNTAPIIGEAFTNVE